MISIGPRRTLGLASWNTTAGILACILFIYFLSVSSLQLCKAGIALHASGKEEKSVPTRSDEGR